jgi:hypothetical protein
MCLLLTNFIKWNIGLTLESSLRIPLRATVPPENNLAPVRHG